MNLQKIFENHPWPWHVSYRFDGTYTIFDAKDIDVLLNSELKVLDVFCELMNSNGSSLFREVYPVGFHTILNLTHEFTNSIRETGYISTEAEDILKALNVLEKYFPKAKQQIEDWYGNGKEKE